MDGAWRSPAADAASRVGIRPSQTTAAATTATAPRSEATDGTLLQLEDEWRQRLEAPFVQLAEFEQTLNRAIDRVHASLPSQ